MISRRRQRLITLFILFISCIPFSQPRAQSTPQFAGARQGFYQQLSLNNQQQKATAEQIAQRRGLAIRIDTATANQELMAFHDATPIYFTTMNANARISSGAAAIGRGAVLNLRGAKLIAGVWDSSSVNSRHREFGTRVKLKEDGKASSHSTHVAGTIGAAGVDTAALGMASECSIYSFDWLNDTGEAILYGANAPMEGSRIYVSNHSYGRVAGWSLGAYTTTNNQYHWFGKPGETEDYAFGQYDKMTAEWDDVCFNTPYLLPFRAAGNDRVDTAPYEGMIFYYAETGTSETFHVATGPLNDGFDNGGYDTIPTFACGKNVITVGSVEDAISNGLRNISKAKMAIYSAWGPADDGRIKPDIVANGEGVYSCDAWTNSYYTNMSGTSMATPNASGTALLLVEYVARMIGGEALKAATLKALIIHTADDLGAPGPDYQFGWGLINGLAATQIIQNFAANPSTQAIIESDLFTTRTVQAYPFRSDGTTPIRATLCWTDPPGFPVEGLDNPQPVLVNDLDLRIDGPMNKRYLPYVLNPAAPSAPATRGDNHLDNVEQILIPAPPIGNYTLRVERKGNFAHQSFSVILSGSLPDSLVISPTLPFMVQGPEGGPLSLPDNSAFMLYNSSNVPLTWSAATDTPWLQIGPNSGTIAAYKTAWLPISLVGSMDSMEPGIYGGRIHLQNITTGVEQDRGVVLQVRPIDSFKWSPIPDQRTDQPFDVQLTALDTAGSTVTAYAGSVRIQGFLPDGGEAVTGLGDDATTSVLASASSAGRIQCLYKFNQIETTGTIFSISLDVHSIPAGPIDQFKIRMKHTTKSSFATADWEEGKWFTVYDSKLVITKLAWNRIMLSSFFKYNGHDNLLVEFSYRNANPCADGISRTSKPGGMRTLSYADKSTTSDPVNWSDGGPKPFLGADLPDLKLNLGIPVYPNQSGSFVGGIWKGKLRIGHGAKGMLLYASDANQVDAESDTFDVLEVPLNTNVQPGGWTLY